MSRATGFYRCSPGNARLVSRVWGVRGSLSHPTDLMWARWFSTQRRGGFVRIGLHLIPRRPPAVAGCDPSAVQAKLCRRIERHIKSLPRTGYGELFVFVAEPEVPSDNNAAERSRRHLVISRKVSGGTRSEQGTERKMTLASIFGTWRAQGLNPLAACRQLLVSPRL